VLTAEGFAIFPAAEFRDNFTAGPGRAALPGSNLLLHPKAEDLSFHRPPYRLKTEFKQKIYGV
jgi:hypothetical protein